MDSVLPQLLAFPPHPPPPKALSDAEYDKQIGSLVNILNTLSASKLTGGVSAGGDLLDASPFCSILNSSNLELKPYRS